MLYFCSMGYISKSFNLNVSLRDISIVTSKIPICFAHFVLASFTDTIIIIELSITKVKRHYHGHVP